MAAPAITGSSPNCSTTSSTPTHTPRSTPAGRRRCSRPCGCLCTVREIPAQLALESGMACGFGACFGCVVQTRTGYVRLCLDGPVLEAAASLAPRRLRHRGWAIDGPISADSSSRARSSTAPARSTRSPPGGRSAIELLEPVPVRGIRLQDRDRRAAAGQPAAAAVGAAGRADELDRAAQQGTARLSGRGPAGAVRAPGAADRQRDGLQPTTRWPSWWTRLRSATRSRRSSSTSRARTSRRVS